jgi:hypothetical protein
MSGPKKRSTILPTSGPIIDYLDKNAPETDAEGEPKFDEKKTYHRALKGLRDDANSDSPTSGVSGVIYETATGQPRGGQAPDARVDRDELEKAHDDARADLERRRSLKQKE